VRVIVEANATRGATLDLSPAFSLHARVLSVTADGRKLAFTAERNDRDQHIHLRLPISGARQQIVMRTEGDLRLAYTEALPQLGEASRGLRLISESWSRDGVEGRLQFAGLPGGRYEVALVGAQNIERVEGAELLKPADGAASLRVTIPQTTSASVVLELKKRK